MSSTFKDHQKIPPKYTCDGEDINPPLEFEDIPENATTLVLIVEDPDAPGRTFHHWILFNMDPSTDHIDEDSVPASAVEGRNDAGTLEYVGPCPPSGTHRYFFRLFALDDVLNLEEGAVATEVKQEMEGYIIDTSELVGTYARS